MKKGKRIFISVLCVILAIILALGCAFLLVRYVGKSKFNDQNTSVALSSFDEVEVNEDEVSYDGKAYVPNKDVINILFMGVDKDSISTELGYGKNGQADTIVLAAVNTKTKSIKMIPISRETMTDVNIYSASGDYVGVKYEQLCLAYNYGNTPEKCCENVINSVKRIFYGINIDSFVAIDLNGAGKLSTAVGGIALNSIEDITIGNKTVKTGDSLYLTGVDAVRYIQVRGQDVNANNRRMERQKQFMTAFVSKAANQIVKNPAKIKTYYKTATPYISTNLSFSQITYIVSSVVSKNLGSKLTYSSIPGKTTEGKEWVEFVPDKDAILKIIMETYYTEK